MYEINQIIDQLKDYFADLKNDGVNFILQRHIHSQPTGTEPNQSVSFSSATASKGKTDRKNELELFFNEITDCSRCLQLAKTRKQVVFGSGCATADLMFVGEAPGQEEDIQGLPFVGKAGKLLTKIIQSIGLKREDVYIANVLKCRPPSNRNPLPEEIENCKEFLERQIDIIRPKVICTLGAFAAQTLLNTTRNISALRGAKQQLGDIVVIPTFHPSYLLRSPQKKQEVWRDMLLVKKLLSQ